MGRELISDGVGIKNTPLVAYRDSKPGYFTGKLIGCKRNVGENNKTVWKFSVVDGDLPTKIKVDKDFIDVDVQPGDTVDMWGSTILDSLLSKAEVGETVKINYEGKGKKQVGRQAPYMFTASVLD